MNAPLTGGGRGAPSVLLHSSGRPGASRQGQGHGEFQGQTGTVSARFALQDVDDEGCAGGTSSRDCRGRTGGCGKRPDNRDLSARESNLAVKVRRPPADVPGGLYPARTFDKSSPKWFGALAEPSSWFRVLVFLRPERFLDCTKSLVPQICDLLRP